MVIRNSAASQQAAADTATAAVTMLAYTRLSVLKADADVAGDSTSKQAGRIKLLARQYRASIVGWFSDDNITAAYDVLYEDKPKHRPGFKALLEAITQQRPTYIGSTFGDRLTRNQEEWVALLKVCARAGTKIASEARVIDPRNHGDRMVGTFETFMAEQYVEQIRAKVRSALADRRRDGIPAFGGRRPFGLAEDKVTPYEPEAALIRDLAQRVLSGEPVRTMATSLNDAGVPTPSDAMRVARGERAKGTQWTAQAIKQLLRRASNCGWIEHEGVMVRPYAVVESGEVTPIMDRDTFDRVFDALAQRSAKARLTDHYGRRAANGHFLTGLLTCGACGAPMHGGTKAGPASNPGARIRRYACMRSCMAINAEATEDAVRELVLALRASPEHMHNVAEAAEGRSAEWRKLHERYLELGQDLDELAGDLNLSPRVLQVRTNAIERERAKLKVAMDKIDPADAGAQAKLRARAAKRLALEWQAAEANPMVRRQMVLDVVAGFTVAPSARGNRTPAHERLEVIPLT